ncbi:Hypothetical protein Ccan_00100 [Capnocytophaga canimorsus Cc5]|uniref:Uncharacterized protein n=1 Tax=Capnocytophaga canimorsus (strain 5) TaxID=860228 RepID=F9YPF9_CAPCC|nr:Hypothetical protein Ccan_00100 [Capnocytophaga canimorsus Cc5]
MNNNISKFFNFIFSIQLTAYNNHHFIFKFLNSIFIINSIVEKF